MTIVDIYNEFQLLQKTSSRLEKEEILRKHVPVDDFCKVLQFLLDPMIVTGISTKKINKQILRPYTCLEEGMSVCTLLDYLKHNNTGTDADIAFVQDYVNCLAAFTGKDDEIVSFLYSIVTKSFRLGVSVTTANKIYGKDFIKTLDVMLGTSIENCKIPENAWISISHKLNGTRCFYYKEHLYSRQGKEFTGCEHIISDIDVLRSTTGHNNYVFDGELLLKSDGILNDSERFQKGTGIANSNQESKQELKLVLFDMLPVDEFENGISVEKYSSRRNMLESIRDVIDNFQLKNVSVVDFVYQGYNHDEIEEALNYAEAHDWEGVMVNLDAPYQCKRTKDLIKVKRFYTYDLRVIRVEQGTGRNANRVGKLVVDFKGNEVGVGSGLSDEQRDYYQEHPEEIIGRVIEVKYKEVTKNKDGSESLQFPTLVSIREEGKEPSLN